MHCNAFASVMLARKSSAIFDEQGAWLRRRKEPIIAIGGGVCLDVCGLAANLYRRNTPVIKVPTHPPCAYTCTLTV